MKKTIRVGMIEITESARILFHSKPVSAIGDQTQSQGAGYFVIRINVDQWSWKSLELHMNWNNATETMDGFTIGTTI